MRPQGTEPDAANEGDALLLGDRFSRMPLDRIATLFGDSFTQAVTQSAPGGWVGPLRSGYGLHLVLVTAVEPGNCLHSSRFGRQWSASGSPDAAMRRKRLSIKASFRATK